MKKVFIIFIILIILLFSMGIGVTWAAEYPTKPITLYVGYSAGGATDTAARIVTNQVNKSLEQPMVVNNKPGGGSAVAADFVAKSKADGYTLFNATITTVIQTVANPNNPFKINDFTPIVGLYNMPLVIVVKGDSKITTIEEFIDFAKKNPNRLNVGTPGVNSVHHFGLELFKREAGISVNHIPFQGDAPGVVGVMGGHVDAAFLGLVAVAEQMKGGTMKGLAMTTSKRVPHFPNLPTMAEKGFAKTGYIFSWGGVFAPAGLPMAILEKLSAAYQKAGTSPDIVNQLEKVGFTATYMNAKEFDHFVKEEYKRLADIAQSAQMIQK
jgi:tripartite-type tricarboxylate transporter receptor subunit TctC